MADTLIGNLPDVLPGGLGDDSHAAEQAAPAGTHPLITAPTKTFLASFTMKRGDTLPSLVDALSDANGPVDLTGAAVVFHMAALTGQVLVSKPAEVTDAVNGGVRYDWQPGDVKMAGDVQAEWRVTFADGAKCTFPDNGYLPGTILRDLAA